MEYLYKTYFDDFERVPSISSASTFTKYYLKGRTKIIYIYIYFISMR